MSWLLEEAAAALWAAEVLGCRYWQESPRDPNYCPLSSGQELQGQVRTALTWSGARMKCVREEGLAPHGRAPAQAGGALPSVDTHA